jgi:adenine deaminase
MMNFPGVLHGDAEVMKKIAAALAAGKPIDGHAPGLRGEQAKQYIAAGITTDHECFTREEAVDKLAYGMKILIREGSAAKNFEALIDLLHDYPDRIMFCSDDKHPDSLVLGHINELCARAAKRGIDVFRILQAACLNPVIHYGLDVGLLRVGDPADLIEVTDLSTFKVNRTFIEGKLVAEGGRSLIVTEKAPILNNFSCRERTVRDFKMALDKLPGSTYRLTDDGKVEGWVIEALDGQLITNRLKELITVRDGYLVSDPKNDVLKMVVVNRYNDAPISFAFIKSFGLKQGAIASTVAHDSHNIVAIGVDDESLCQAVNLLIANRGGVSCVKDNTELVVPLPVAGLMSNEDGYHVARQYALVDQAAKEAGSGLASPFMTLSFMALLVIPHLKLSDLGLFDCDKFELLK